MALESNKSKILERNHHVRNHATLSSFLKPNQRIITALKSPSLWMPTSYTRTFKLSKTWIAININKEELVGKRRKKGKKNLQKNTTCIFVSNNQH